MGNEQKKEYLQKLDEKIREYKVEELLGIDNIKQLQNSLAELLGIGTVLVRDNGELLTEPSNLSDFEFDAANPGLPIMIEDRCFAYLYVDKKGFAGDEAALDALLESLLKQFEQEGESRVYYLVSQYMYGDVAEKLENEKLKLAYEEKFDSLTGFASRMYFESRLHVVDRAEIVPVALIAGNINDLKHINDTYGYEEGDKIIQTISLIMQEEGEDYYIYGRFAGDELYVVIPRGEREEAQDYCDRIQKRLLGNNETEAYPSMAMGVVVKDDVHISIIDLISDAEYEMYENKLRMKSQPEYKEKMGKNE